MNQAVIHLDLDTFFVSVERLQNSNLLGKPVVIGGNSDRGVVAACSYEARQFGVHSAMPMRMAKYLCPEAIVIKGDMQNYSDYSDMVTQIIVEKSPVVEKASIDEFYIDASGMDKFFGCYKWATELRSTVMKETGLPISLGLSVNKTVSKIATGQAKPNGQIQVLTGTEKPFLAPLSVSKIPMVGDKTYTTLRNMGVNKILTIQQMDVELMERVLGVNGVTIWRKANGIDDSLVIPHTESQSISTQESFHESIDMEFLTTKLSRMADRLSFQLRQSGRLTTCVTVKIRYSDFQVQSQQGKILYTASEQVLTEKAIQLFKKLYTKRMLLNQIALKFSNLIRGNYQLDLFNQTIRETNLNKAMDSIRNRFGANTVMIAKNFIDASQRA